MSKSLPVLHASQVLDRMTDLHERMAHPNRNWVGYIRGFAESLVSKGHGGRIDPNNALMMFYPYEPQRGEVYAAQWLVETGKGLFQSVTYQVTPEMLDVATDIYLASATGVEHIEYPELPAEHGFMWLDRPLILTDARGKEISTRAITWSVLPITYRPHDLGSNAPVGKVRRGMGVRIVMWNLTGDPNYYQPDRLTVQELGDLQLDHIMVIPFGERFPAEETAVTSPEGVAAGRPKTASSALHYVHVLWLLMNQELVASHARPHISRTSQLRARSVMHDEVTVVTLRRVRHHETDPDTESGHVDWSCRWLVTGHWRHIEGYGDHPRHHAIADTMTPGEPRCVTCDKRITWIKPFIKGPDGKPLRMSEKIYRLAR